VEKQIMVPNPALGSPTSWQLAHAAIRLAAAQFARCGFDVSVQHAADWPVYDLVVARVDTLLKVSVKGSQDGAWPLTQSYLKPGTDSSRDKTNYQRAIDMWMNRHGSRTVCCLVQFQGVAIDQLPRIYLASPAEIAVRLRNAACGRGDSILCEEWSSPSELSTTVERLPSNWLFSTQRIEELADREAWSTPRPLAAKQPSSIKVPSLPDSSAYAQMALLPLTA
jgi:hypothetical protein